MVSFIIYIYIYLYQSQIMKSSPNVRNRRNHETNLKSPGSRTSGSGPWTECSRRATSRSFVPAFLRSANLPSFVAYRQISDLRSKAEKGPIAVEDNEEAQNITSLHIFAHAFVVSVPCHSLLRTFEMFSNARIWQCWKIFNVW